MLKKKTTQIPTQSGNPKIEFNSMSREEFSKTTLMGVLQFGAETLLAEAVKAEIDRYLGRSRYQHVPVGETSKGERNGYPIL